MKKNRVTKLSLSRETLHRLADLNQIWGGTGADSYPGSCPQNGCTEGTCFETCYCRSAYTCYWSECGCPTSGC